MGAQMPPEDLNVVQAAISALGASRILEFGPGRSTEAILSLPVDLVAAAEPSERWLGEARRRFGNDRRFEAARFDKGADPYSIPPFDDLHFDLAVVDSPPGNRVAKGERARWQALLYAADRSPVILLHDAHRDGEKLSIAALESEGWVSFTVPTRKGMAVLRRD